MNYYGIAVLNSIFSVFLAETGILFYIFILNDALLDDIKIKRDNELKYMLLMAPFISALLAFGTSSWQNGNTLGILGAFIIVILFVEVLMKKRD